MGSIVLLGWVVLDELNCCVLNLHHVELARSGLCCIELCCIELCHLALGGTELCVASCTVLRWVVLVCAALH